MPRKGGRHAREPSLARSPHRNNRRDTTDNSQQQQQQQQQVHNNQQQQQQQQRPAVKHFRPVHIGPVNGKRWLALKKRLGLANDEDVAVYLLDLAESVTRNDDKCNGTEDETRRERDEGENDETILPVKETLHRPEEPLRRSTRVQNSQEGAAADGPTLVEDARPTEDREKSRVKSRGSRSRHHRNKGKHHKDKRKRKRHSKDPETTLDGEKGKHLHQEPGTEERTDTKPETASDRFEVSEGSVSTKTEHVDRVELVENVNNTERRGEEEEEEEGGTNPRIVQDVHDDLPADERRIDQDQDRFQAPSLEGDVLDKEAPGTVQEEGIQDAQEPGSALKEGSEERRSRKRRRRPRYEFDDEEDTEPRDVSSEDIPEAETTHKHRRKRHRHGGEHKNRKHHDVRKAPQDGIVVVQDPVQDTQGALDGANQTERTEPEVNSAENNHRDERSPVAEPQRLAIKIKLCQECNSRHLQDACPLTSPRYSIQDTVRFEDWLERHKDNTEVAKAIKSDDPMSEGYGGKIADEPFESDEEATQPSEHAKVKGNKAQREEKLLTVDVDRPLYARDSLPDCFELRIANSEHGLGIYAKSSVPMYVKLGPLVGRPVREMDIPDDFSMRHIWEIDNNGRTTYVSTTNPLRSNWIRYIRPADTKEERSVAVITKQGELHLVTTQNIVSGMELTYWADSQSSAWTRKNKVDKTNCGGCNLNFAHPIYYRLHCCIFHDTNYSLTIRKYHCKVCGAAVLGKDNIMKHAAELHAGRGAYQCQYCKKFFLRLNYLEMHRTYGCAQNPQRSRPLCDFCGRKFCQPQKLKVHIKRMHSDMSEVLREFQCKLCLKLLGSRAALQRHMKEVHHKDVVGAATCDRCGKMFQNKSNLKIHMLTHSGVKPFKCKENGCKAAFTTKQCLQFHYKKVHGLTEEMMPKIERSVAYTFDAYSGGLVEDAGRGKTPRPSRRNSQHQENSNSLPSLDDCSSESNMKMEPASNPVHAAIIEFQNGPSPKLTKYKVEHDSRISTPVLPPAATVCNALEPGIEPLRPETDLYTSSRLQSKGSKKWLGEFNPPNPGGDVSTGHMTGGPVTGGNVYEFEESRKESPDEKVTAGNNQVPRPPPPPPPPIIEDNKLGLSVYRRTESSNASLLVEAALDAAERDIGAVSSPILEDNDRDGNLYSISGQLQSPMPQRSPGHLETYMQQQQQQQQDELISPAPTPDNRHTPPGHLDYHLHRPCPVDYLATARATHNMDQYLHHEDMQRVASPNSYMHLQQDDLVSPSATPNPRYQEVHHHHQVPTDNLSSDEGDSVAQNLSLSVKEKPPQLDLSTSYKYDTLDQEFRDRANFEPLVLNAGELQGLDMSARGFHHAGFPGQVQNTRYHHHHHLYEIAERQSVDLSRTGGYSMSPPPPLPPPQPPPTTAPPPPPYPHTDVLRVVSLDLTPGGRHSVDLTLSRSHHLHGSGGRVIASPQPPPGSGTTPHVVPDNVVDSRILSPPPPPLSGYNPSYPVSPAPYHPPRPGYHPYSGYY